jgi:hypothetical protein
MMFSGFSIPICREKSRWPEYPKIAVYNDGFAICPISVLSFILRHCGVLFVRPTDGIVAKSSGGARLDLEQAAGTLHPNSRNQRGRNEKQGFRESILF